MSERLMQEFRERAERLIPLPDLDELRRRGAARRRVRLAAGAAVLASALAIGGIVVATTIDDENAIGPAQIGPTRINPTPPPSARDCELLEPENGGWFASVPSGCELPAWVDVWAQKYVDPGPYFFRPLNTDLAPARSGDLEAHFVIPGDYWYWWGGGAGKANPAGPEFSLYQRIAITPIIGVHEQRCQGSAPDHVQAVPESVLSVAQTLVASPGVEVLEGPSSVQKFGYDAAHVRFTVTERCPGDPAFSGPSMLWRAFETRDEIDVEDDTPVPDGDIYTFAGHVLDVWVVDVKGEHVVVSADTAHTNAADLSEMRELLDSIRFEFTEALVP